MSLILKRYLRQWQTPLRISKEYVLNFLTVAIWVSPTMLPYSLHHELTQSELAKGNSAIERMLLMVQNLGDQRRMFQKSRTRIWLELAKQKKNCVCSRNFNLSDWKLEVYFNEAHVKRG